MNNATIMKCRFSLAVNLVCVRCNHLTSQIRLSVSEVVLSRHKEDALV